MLKPLFARLLSDYGMLARAGCCSALFFSVATYSEQSPTGEAAGRQVAAADSAEHSSANAPRVLVVGRDQPDDAAFAAALPREAERPRADRCWPSSGENRRMLARRCKRSRMPGEARRHRLHAGRLGAGSCSPICRPISRGSATPLVVKPQTYRWPNFLKSDNLLNIANQIAVIAIVAIGMTIVIITGGIDLSVGSLIALAAVLAALFIRDCAGGVNASAAGMTLACLAAARRVRPGRRLLGAMITLFGIPPFIVTLAMMLVASGLAYLLAQGQSVYQVPDSFIWLGRGADLFGIPNAVLLMLVLYFAAHVLMSRMRLGRYIYAVGGQSRSSAAFGRAGAARIADCLHRQRGRGRFGRSDHGLAAQERLTHVRQRCTNCT